MSELGGEKIDIIEWSENLKNFIEDALSPARVASVELLEQEGETMHTAAKVTVAPDQQSLAIGRGGQNVRLAAKLTGAKIDIVSSAPATEAAPAAAQEEVKEETEESA
jgi:N utilization substance protein A